MQTSGANQQLAYQNELLLRHYQELELREEQREMEEKEFHREMSELNGALRRAHRSLGQSLSVIASCIVLIAAAALYSKFK